MYMQYVINAVVHMGAFARVISISASTAHLFFIVSRLSKGLALADPKDVEQNKVYAILAYLGILVLVPLLAAKESKFAQYHANQGLVLFIADIICGFVIWIPVVGWAVGIALLVLWIMGIMNAA